MGSDWGTDTWETLPMATTRRTTAQREVEYPTSDGRPMAETEFPATPTLRVVPDLDHDQAEVDFDLSTVQPAEVWNPATTRPWRQ